MDNHQSGVEKSEEQIIWSISTENQWSGSPSKSYTCTFCNKGFSSAQALGGHMNIHRKDRAKLREENILSLGLAKPLDQPNDKRGLSLEFVEESTTCNPRDDIITSSIKDLGDSPIRDDEGTEFEPSCRSIRTEVDLELRLGPEPNEISTTRNPREFF